MENPTPTPIDWPCRGLEERITEIWGHINAANYQFLRLVAEYDAEEGWGWHGITNRSAHDPVALDGRTDGLEPGDRRAVAFA